MTVSINQLRLNNLQSVKTNKITIEEILNTEEHEEIYAIKGEENYNAAMDFNGDGVVTYDEFLRYCTENAVAQYHTSPSYTINSPVQELIEHSSVRPVHIGII